MVSVKLFKISFRNIFRNKRRSVLTMLILILGCSGLILVGGYFDSLEENFREQFIHSHAGHLQVNSQGYFDKGVADPFQFLIKDSSGLQRFLEVQPHVVATVPRLKFSGMASAGSTTIGVLALGVDPRRETMMGNYRHSNARQAATQIIEGRDLDPSDPNGVVLGIGLKKALGLKVGEIFQFITNREGGALEGGNFYVRGVFETILKDFDDRAMKLNLSYAQEMLALPDQVHSLLVLLDNTKWTLSLHRRLQEEFRIHQMPFEAITWEAQGQFYRQSKDMLNKIYATIQIIISIIFFLSIANTVNMAIFERIREFGTMLSIGNTRGTVFRVIFCEAILIALIGSALGLAFGSGLAALISAIGIEMPPVPNSSAGYSARILLTHTLLLRTFLIASLATVLAAVIPGVRAARFRIIDALGHV